MKNEETKIVFVSSFFDLFHNRKEIEYIFRKANKKIKIVKMSCKFAEKHVI